MNERPVSKEELRSWRERLDLTRKDLATQLDVSPRTIEAWEQGTREIPLRSSKQIRSLMQMDVLKIQTDEELREKIRRFEKSTGKSVSEWARELLKSALPLV